MATEGSSRISRSPRTTAVRRSIRSRLSAGTSSPLKPSGTLSTTRRSGAKAIRAAQRMSRRSETVKSRGLSRIRLWYAPEAALATVGSVTTSVRGGRGRPVASGLPVRWGGDFKDFHDPGHFEIDGDASAAPALKLDGVLEPPLKLDGILEPAEDDDVIRVNATKGSGMAASSMSPLPSSPAPNPQTSAGRAERDAGLKTEADPNARKWVDVRLPEGVRDWSDVPANEVVKTGVRQWAQSRGIPSDFTEQWIGKNGGGWKLYDLATKQPLTTDEAMGREDIYDLANRSFRLSTEMPILYRLEQDYQNSRGAMGGLSDLAADETHSPFEKLKAVTWDSPQGRETRAATRAGADYMRRAVNAANVGGWAYALGQGGGGAAAQSALAFSDEPTAFDNPAGDIWRAGVEAAAPYAGSVAGAVSGNATIGKVAGAAIEPQMLDAARTGQAVLGVVAQPLNIVPLGEVSELFRAGQLGRAAAEGGELSARVSKLLRPLGLEAPEHAAEQSLDVILRGADGTHYLADTATHEITNLSTGELVELPRSPHDSLSSAGYKVERVSAPNRTAGGEAPDV